MNKSSLAVCLASLVLLAPPASAQNVRVLDATSGPYTSLAGVINASADGDIILVEPGNYNPLGIPTIASKSLTIVAADPANPPVFVRPYLRIQDLAPADELTATPADTVVIRGIRFERRVDTVFEGVSITGNEGAVHFEDCTFVTTVGALPPVVTPGATALPAIDISGIGLPQTTALGEVIFTRCVIEGARGYESFGPFGPMNAGPAIRATGQAGIGLFDCTVVGGFAGNSEPGAAGVELYDGTLLTGSGGSIVGGAGGATGSSPSCAPGGDGGTAVIGSGSIILTGTSLSGGAGGISQNSGCTAGQQGLPVDLTGATSTVDLQPGIPNGIESTDTYVLDPGSLTLDLIGPFSAGPIPTVGYWLFASNQLSILPIPGAGAAALKSPGTVLTDVLLGGAGTLNLPVQGQAGAGEGRVIHAQASYYDTTTAQFHWGAPTAIVFVNDGFDPN